MHPNSSGWGVALYSLSVLYLLLNITLLLHHRFEAAVGALIWSLKYEISILRRGYGAAVLFLAAVRPRGPLPVECSSRFQGKENEWE